MNDPMEYGEPATMDSTEELDEDELGTDPLEGGLDAPDGWAEADRWGTTPREEREGESLDQRLREEEPDVEP